MTLKVAEFFEAGEDRLEMTLESGHEHLDNVIREETVNRPGLALAGFLQYFAQHRVQVLGLAEYTYLKSLSKQDRAVRLRKFFECRIPCVVFTRNRHAFPEVKALAEEYGVPVMRSSQITSHFVNQATLIMEQLRLPTMRAQGTMVDILGVGVLIEGTPGIGKSETAMALISRGHSLVADDITVLRKDGSGAIIGSAVDITRYHMEIRGLGIIHVPSLYGIASMRGEKRLDLIVRLRPPDPDIEEDRTGLNPQTRSVMDQPIPLVSLPVAAGRSMAHVVEVAALNQKLKDMGHDAAKELDERIVQILARKGGAT